MFGIDHLYVLAVFGTDHLYVLAVFGIGHAVFGTDHLVGPNSFWHWPFEGPLNFYGGLPPF